MASVELKLAGGETGLRDPAFSDQSPPANDAEADETEMTVPQCGLQGRLLFEGTAHLSHHEAAKEPGILLFDDPETVGAAVGEAHMQAGGFDLEIGCAHE
jgi:hypothetical protein